LLTKTETCGLRWPKIQKGPPEGSPFRRIYKAA
jgi:hypothetical protein